MRYTKYLFTPHDLAIFIRFANFTVSRENEVLKDLFNNHNADILFPYREDFLLFRKSVSNLLIKYEMDFDDLDEAQMIMRDVNGASTEQTSEPDYYCWYFKLIKLRLLYTQDSIKMKMSTLLSDFGYKRRSKDLVATIKTAIKKLNLVPYTRGYELCDIGDVDIHTMIIFRLGEEINEDESLCSE